MSVVTLSELLFLFDFFKNPETGSNSELLLSLKKILLRSLEEQEGLPNPSVHLALRLSDSHNLAMESVHLNKLKSHLHNDLQK